MWQPPNVPPPADNYPPPAAADLHCPSRDLPDEPFPWREGCLRGRNKRRKQNDLIPEAPWKEDLRKSLKALDAKMLDYSKRLLDRQSPTPEKEHDQTAGSPRMLSPTPVLETADRIVALQNDPQKTNESRHCRAAEKEWPLWTSPKKERLRRSSRTEKQNESEPSNPQEGERRSSRRNRKESERDTSTPKEDERRYSRGKRKERESEPSYPQEGERRSNRGQIKERDEERRGTRRQEKSKKARKDDRRRSRSRMEDKHRSGSRSNKIVLIEGPGFGRWGKHPFGYFDVKGRTVKCERRGKKRYTVVEVDSSAETESSTDTEIHRSFRRPTPGFHLGACGGSRSSVRDLMPEDWAPGEPAPPVGPADDARDSSPEPDRTAALRPPLCPDGYPDECTVLANHNEPKRAQLENELEILNTQLKRMQTHMMTVQKKLFGHYRGGSIPAS